MVKIQEVDPSFCLLLDGEAQLGAKDIEVRRNWEQLRQVGRDLHDGPLMALKEVQPGYAKVLSTSYRYLMCPDVPIKFLAVSAWVEFDGKVLLGRRSQHVNQYPGLWELAPAGSLDRLDYLSCLTSELREELGVSVEQVIGLEPLATLDEGRVVDILVKVYLKSLPSLLLNEELDEVLWLPVVGAREWAKKCEETLVPMTCAALGYFGR